MYDFTEPSEILSATQTRIKRQRKPRSSYSTGTAYDDLCFIERRGDRNFGTPGASTRELPQTLRPSNRRSAICPDVSQALRDTYGQHLDDLLADGIPRTAPLSVPTVEASQLRPPLWMKCNVGGTPREMTLFSWGGESPGRALTEALYTPTKLLKLYRNGSSTFSSPFEFSIATHDRVYGKSHDYLYATAVEPFYNANAIAHLEHLYPRTEDNIFVVPRKTANALILRNYTEDVPINLGKFLCLTHLLGVTHFQAIRYMNILEYHYHMSLFTRLVGHGVIDVPNFKGYQPLIQHHDAPNYSKTTYDSPTIDVSLFPQFDLLHHQEAPDYSKY